MFSSLKTGVVFGALTKNASDKEFIIFQIKIKVTSWIGIKRSQDLFCLNYFLVLTHYFAHVTNPLTCKTYSTFIKMVQGGGGVTG